MDTFGRQRSMNIPRAWAKATAECRTRDNRDLEVTVWRWGREEATAQREAASRLGRLLDRIRAGQPFPDAYAYGSRPLREKIVQYVDGEASEHPRAVVTRNSYGVSKYATCRYLETVGSGRVSRAIEPLVALHDRATRCGELLPLA